MADGYTIETYGQKHMVTHNRNIWSETYGHTQ